VTTLIPPYSFTHQKSKLGAVVNVTTGNPSGDIGSQHLPSEFSPEKNEERKRAVKVGGSIAKPDVVAVPFGTLPGDFGIHPPAKDNFRKGVAQEVAASNMMNKEVKVPVSVTVEEVAKEVKVPVSLTVTKEVTSKRFCNVADDHAKNMKKKTKVKSVETKDLGHGKKSALDEVSNEDEFDFDNLDVFDFDDVKEQPKKASWKEG
jgi:hypothetical protein